jgi:hypothetical protein
LRKPPAHLIWLTWLAALVCYWLIQGFSLGMSDDEAYYWVLSQKPALGYAYHPPLVAWTMTAFETLTAWIPALSREGRARLGAILLAASFFAIGLGWVRSVLRSEQRREPGPGDLVLTLLPGLAGVAWMIVPDLPLFLGWSLCWWGCWVAAHAKGATTPRATLLLFAGAVAGLLSKFSAVLFLFSSAVLILFLPKVSITRRRNLLFALAAGAVVGLVPTLIWNFQNDWVSIRYQFVERHRSGGGIDLKRYLQFWGAQLLLVGPALILWSLLQARTLIHGTTRSVKHRFVLAFALPAAGVFWLQPLVSEFKPHWALIAWWPLALWAATESRRPRWLVPLHAIWCVGLLGVWTAFSHWPLQARLTEWATGKSPDPRWDITNDFYGWDALPRLIESKLGSDGLSLPVLGSRYQTAAQAAFSLESISRVSLVGRRPGETQEWSKLSDHLDPVEGSYWPKLKAPVLFVADQRYSEGPKFKDASCSELGSAETLRGRHQAKRIQLWRCQPN